MKQCWGVHISGGIVELGNITPDREALSHPGSPSGRAEQMSSRPKMCRDAAKGRQKSLRMPQRFKAFHRPFTLAGGLMRILGSIVQILRLPVGHRRHQLGQRLTLYARAVLAPGDFDGFGYPEAVSGLADRITRSDDLTGRAVAETARHVRIDTFNRQDCVAGHLHGLRGWAKVADRLPEAPEADDEHDPAVKLFTAVWRLVDELLFPLLRGDELPTVLTDFIWTRLQTTCPGLATGVLCDMRRALVPGYNSDTVFAPHDLLLNAYPDQVRTLMQWALTHRDQLKEWPDPGIHRYVVASLGRVGVQATADMLRHYVHHPDLEQAAVAAIKAIETRSDASP
jgi:hypothetical protein